MAKRKIVTVHCFFIAWLVSTSCSDLPPFANKKDLIGHWSCKSIEITTAKHNQAIFALEEYGYATFIINRDSSFSFSLNILRDIIIEKEVFGNIYSNRIIQAGYKIYRSGYYRPSNRSILFLDVHKNNITEEEYFFRERILTTKYIDKDNNSWMIFWEKNK